MKGRAESCLVYSNRMNHCGGLYVDAGGEAWNCTVVRNEILRQNGTVRSGAGVNCPSKGSRVVNCVFAENTTPYDGFAGYPEWSGDVACFENCAFSDSAPAGEHDISGPVFFQDPDALDFRLARNSPCKDKGRFDLWMAGEKDLEGKPRVDHKERVDIGCYERRYAPPHLILMVR